MQRYFTKVVEVTFGIRNFTLKRPSPQKNLKTPNQIRNAPLLIPKNRCVALVPNDPTHH